MSRFANFMPGMQFFSVNSVHYSYILVKSKQFNDLAQNQVSNDRDANKFDQVPNYQNLSRNVQGA